jgi:DegV family protein with EDD domain
MSKKFGIITDSGADFSLEYMKENDVVLIPTRIMVGETEYIDRHNITRDEIIDKMLNDKAKTSTSVAPPADFHQIISEALEKHEKVLFIGISAKMSATIQNALLTAKRLKTENFYAFDTETVSWGMTLLLDHTVRRRDQGISLDVVIKELEQMKSNLQLYFMVDTLEYLRRGGRIGAAKSLLGTLIGAKPMLTVKDGEITSAETVKTFEAAIEIFENILEEKAKEYKNYAIAIIYGIETPEFEKFSKKIKNKFEPLSFYYEPIGANIISHAGPKLFGFGIIEIPDNAIDAYK